MTGPMLDGRYRLVAPLARGGMSVVWRGHDDVLARTVAIKVIDNRDAAADTSFLDRVRREAMAVARLTHPHIATVYDYGESATDGGPAVPYIVMELVDGETLAQVLRRGPLAWPTALGIGAQIAAALAAAHAHGVVHRDITPSNVMLCADGVKVIDFGIAAPAGDVSDAQVFGTPAYLAPERVTGGAAVPATDVYGLGLILYESLAGRLPWPAASATQMVSAHRHQPPTPLPPIPGLPDVAADVVHRCLAVDPAARPTSIALFGELAPIARGGDRRRAPGLSAEPAAVAAARITPNGTRIMPTGTRVVPHGVTDVPDPTSSTVPVRPPERIAGAAVARGRARPPVFMLPTILLGVLLGCLGLAQLGTGTATMTSPAPSHTAPGLFGGPTIDGARATPTRVPRTPRTACQVDYNLTGQWFAGFTAQLTIRNVGDAMIAGWTLRFTLGGGQRVGGGWNGRWQQHGSQVTVTDVAFNRSLPPGATVTLGFLGAAPRGAITAPRHFSINGTPCS